MPLYPDFNRIYPPAGRASEPTVWLPFRGRDLLLLAKGEEEVEPLLDTSQVREALGSVVPLELGHLMGIHYLAADLPAEFVPPDAWRAVDLWRLHGRISEPVWTIAGYASHILHWERTSRFCPVCGHPSDPMQLEWMRNCPQCSHIRYPQISPAVLMLVHDGADRILLSHKPGWGERYSILAGFVLPGESLEECVHREVQEEVGLEVEALVYAGSQPWPFPQQLMIGFTARYKSGEIRIDEEELDHAAWFDVRELPPLPANLSLSRQMIDAWRRSLFFPS